MDKNKTNLTKDQANQVCADIMTFAMVRTGRVLDFQFEYLYELSHLFQKVFGDEFYSRHPDYDEIYRLTTERLRELDAVRDRGTYFKIPETSYDMHILAETQQLEEDAEEARWKDEDYPYDSEEEELADRYDREYEAEACANWE
jgi:hypothetical protein